MHLKTYKIKTIHIGDNLFEHLSCVDDLSENSVVAIATKIVSLCDGTVVDNTQDKLEIAKNLANKVHESKNYPFTMLTIYKAKCLPNAGIDGSNADGNHWVLYPKEPFQSAKLIWEFLKNKYKIKNLGVVLTDSVSQPFRYGATGFAIAWWGFKPLINKIGSYDCFEKPLSVSQVNVVDALASASVLCMGEGNEHQPVVVISQIPQIEFSNANCSLQDLAVPENLDMYQELFEQFI
jgi:F420-0:gamma-glutamyl ligase